MSNEQVPFQMFSNFPKNRPDLPKQYREIYAAEYAANRDGGNIASSLAQKLESWMHKKISEQHGIAPTLELGAGTLNHLKFEKTLEDYDIVEPMDFLFKDKAALTKVRNVFNNIESINAQNIRKNTYKRIISIAVLEHMTDLPAELARCCQLLEKDGVFQAGIPSEGEFLWWLGWRSSTGMSYYLRNRLDYGVLMRHEHVNQADEIISICKYFFKDVRVCSFPFNIKHLSLYKYIEARSPKYDEAAKFIEKSRPV